MLEHGGGESADGVDGGLEGGFVGDAGGVWAGERDAAAGGEIHDLDAGTEDDDDADVERVEDGEVEEDVAEVFVVDEGAVDEDDERLAAELWDVTQNAADIVVFHRAGIGGWDQGRASVGLVAGKSTMVWGLEGWTVGQRSSWWRDGDVYFPCPAQQMARVACGDDGGGVFVVEAD